MFDGAILRAVLNTTNRYRTKQTARKNSSDRSHLGLGRDILPLLLVKLKPPALYLRPEKSPVDMAERGVTAQQDVHDHADAPHVDRLKRQIFMRPTVWAEEGRREERKEKRASSMRNGVGHRIGRRHTRTLNHDNTSRWYPILGTHAHGRYT